MSSVSDSRLARLCCRDITIGIGAQAALKAADESVKAQAAPVKACKAALEERVKVAEDLMVLLSLDDLANVATRFRRVVVSHEDVLNTLSGVDGLVRRSDRRDVTSLWRAASPWRHVSSPGCPGASGAPAPLLRRRLQGLVRQRGWHLHGVPGGALRALHAAPPSGRRQWCRPRRGAPLQPS